MRDRHEATALTGTLVCTVYAGYKALFASGCTSGLPGGGGEPLHGEVDSRQGYAEYAIPADSFARAVVFAMSQPEDADANEILFPAHAAGNTRDNARPPPTNCRTPAT